MRVETAAQNLANATTPGFKARLQFPTLVAGDPGESVVNAPRGDSAIDFTNGQLRNTGNPFDLAISGSGFFVVRSRDGVFYTRNGQFGVDADGRLVTPDGLSLQSSAGDVVVSRNDPKVLADGTVLDGQQPAGRLAIVDFSDPRVLRAAGAGLFSASGETPRDVAVPQVRQGMLETSNVSTADEMLTIMTALQSAQSGAKMVQVYDDLLGRAVTAFGQS